MPGKAILTVNSKRWLVELATSYQELSCGLGGLMELPAGRGMLFDLGYPQHIVVTTEPMLFALDIAFLSKDLIVTEVYRDIEPGYLVASQGPARYFLEVNAGELENVEPGDQAVVDLPPVGALAADTSSSDWTSAVASIVGFATMGLVTARLASDFVSSMLNSSPREALLPLTSQNKGFLLRRDRLGSVIITRPDQPGRSVYLQFQSDQDVVRELLSRSERDELDRGYDVRVPDSQPRASTLWELWQAAVITRGQERRPMALAAQRKGRPLLRLPFAGAAPGKLWWLATLEGQTVTVGVTGIRGLSQIELEEAFCNSIALLPRGACPTEALPFAGASKGSIWWLATEDGVTAEAQVVGIRGLSEQELERSFASSLATISSPSVQSGLVPGALPAQRSARYVSDEGAQFVAYTKDRLGLVSLVVGGIQGEAISATVWRKDPQSSWSGLALVKERTLPLSDENLKRLVEWICSEVPGHYRWQRYEIPLAHSIRLGWHPTITRDEVSGPVLLPRNIQDSERTRVCIEEIALWYVANRREMQPAELERIVSRHFTTESDIRRFAKYLSSKQGQEEFRMALRRAKAGASAQEGRTAVIAKKAQRSRDSALEYLPDSPEYLSQTIEDIGYRHRLDAAFLEAIRRAKGL